MANEKAQRSGDRVIAIIGASGGIGSALAARLSDRGHKLLLGARRVDRLEPMLKKFGPDITDIAAVDASDTGKVDEFFARGMEKFGRIDGVINLAGSILLKPAHLTSDKEFEETLRQNLWSAFAVVRCAGKAMRDTGGSVVLMSTAAARTGIPNHDAIAAAKGGVIGLVQSGAATYAANNIRVNAIAPGLLNSEMAQPLIQSKTALQASEQMHPLGRIGDPAEVASLAEWLLVGESGWVTGQILGIDGGLATVRPRVRVN